MQTAFDSIKAFLSVWSVDGEIDIFVPRPNTLVTIDGEVLKYVRDNGSGGFSAFLENGDRISYNTYCNPELEIYEKRPTLSVVGN